MKNRPHFKMVRISSGVLTLLAGSLFIGRVQAATLYATSISGSQIDKVDTVANTVTTYLNTPSAADSIIFDASGNVIYTELYTGQVVRYNPITTISTTLANSLNTPADMVLEPGGNSMLVSEFTGGNIDRITFSPPGVTTLSTSLGNPEGLAYDGTKLFANIGYRGGGPTGKEVAEINPVTGAIMATSPGLNSLDGLTYDPYSGLLYASSLYGNLVYSIDPNNLSNVQIATGSQIIPAPDGITTDAIGNIFIASSDSLGDSHIYQLDLNTQILTQETFVNGLDDLAPASGAGSVPEPTSLALLGVGGIGILRRRRSASC
jgi:sugar lactone lactonase YvrE